MLLWITVLYDSDSSRTNCSGDTALSSSHPARPRPLVLAKGGVSGRAVFDLFLEMARVSKMSRSGWGSNVWTWPPVAEKA